MKIGIVGVSGFGGSELLRLCASHPQFEIAFVGGESSAGQQLAELFPALARHPAGRLRIQPFVPESLAGIDLLFTSLPTGKSREPLARVAPGQPQVIFEGIPDEAFASTDSRVGCFVRGEAGARLKEMAAA